MPILIDPPVGPYSVPEELRAWIRELNLKRKEYAEDPLAIETIDCCILTANRWLKMSVESRRDG